MTIAAVPAVELRYAGAGLGKGLSLLAEVRVHQALSCPSLCELTFVDPPPDALPDFSAGQPLELALGGDERFFSGRVVGIEHDLQADRSRLLRVRACDPSHGLRLRRSVRAHVQVTVADLASELAGGHGLSVRAEDAGPLIPFAIQHRDHDLDFLARQAERYGLYFYCQDRTMHLGTLEGWDDPIPLAWGKELLTVQVERHPEPSCHGAAASGWDLARMACHRGEAAAGEGNGAERFFAADQAVDDAPQVQAIARARLRWLNAQARRLRATAEGGVRLAPGRRIAVSGAGHDLDGTYVLSEVRHRIEARRGHVCELDTAPPPHRDPERHPVLAVGRVSRVDDPEHRYRVKVRLPACADLESAWLPALGLAAGKGKGLAALSDVGDHVAVLFCDEDRGQGLVLGGLYGPEGACDDGVAGGRARRLLLATGDGRRLILDDQAGRVRLEDPGGNRLDLEKDRVLLHAATDLRIEAPGRRIEIAAAAIDFRRA